MPETRQQKIIRMLAQLEADHGHTITNALGIQQREMTDTARECRESAVKMPDNPRPPVRDGNTITLTPTKSGLIGMAEMFEDSAVKAEKAAEAWDELMTLLDDDRW